MADTALYIRLSREDGTDGESESVRNQRAVLRTYAEAQGMDADEYIDEGWSGTDFARPAFQRLLRDIETGKIKTVITKDLSRLGRDYILTGHYIERYFPSHGVRYLALHDGVDTGAPSAANDMTALRSVLNDWYARDISQKVRHVLDEKRRLGCFIGAVAPYGYRKSTEKGRLCPCEETAPVVRQIYRWYLTGESLRGIAARLSAEAIPTPSMRNGKGRLSMQWNDGTVRRILTNPSYVGNLTQTRTRRINYKVKRRVLLPRTEWVTVAGTHPPLVSCAEFAQVQERLVASGRQKKSPARHVLAGLVFCADCGAAMTFVQESKTRCYLVCGGWRRGKGCVSSHCIREDAVLTAVCEVLRGLAASPACQTETAALLQQRLGEKQHQQLKRRLAANVEMQLTLYRDLAAGRLTAAAQQAMLATLHVEEETLRAATAAEPSAAAIQTAITEVCTFSPPSRQALYLLLARIEIGAEKQMRLALAFSAPKKKAG